MAPRSTKSSQENAVSRHQKPICNNTLVQWGCGAYLTFHITEVLQVINSLLEALSFSSSLLTLDSRSIQLFSEAPVLCLSCLSPPCSTFHCLHLQQATLQQGTCNRAFANRTVQLFGISVQFARSATQRARDGCAFVEPRAHVCANATWRLQQRNCNRAVATVCVQQGNVAGHLTGNLQKSKCKMICLISW